MKPRSKKHLVKNSGPNANPKLKPFELPAAFLNSLNEFSSGGFILIMGNEVGDPQVFSHFDGGLQGIGLVKFGKEFLERLDRDFSNAIDDDGPPMQGDAE